MITYNEWTAVSQSLPFLISIIFCWLFPNFIYWMIGIFKKASSPSGGHYSKPMGCYLNYYWAIFLFTLLLPGLLIILIIFPIWLKLFS